MSSTTLPASMRAMLLTGHGGPEMLVFDPAFRRPEPADGEVLIRVGACGINNTDIWVREGAYGAADDPEAVASFSDSPMQFPLIQGADIAGTIVASGPGVDPARVGERVMVDFGIYADCDPDTPSHDYIGSARQGGFADYVCVPADNAHAVETDLSDGELATFCCAYVTAEHLLRRARVERGERVLVTGASGGVGSAAIQLCRARGAIPYAIVGASKASAVAAIGAEACIARGTEPLAEAVYDATGGQALDVLIDTVAGPKLADTIELLRSGGRYATCGAVGGPLVQLDMRRIYLKNLELHGASQGSRRDFARVRDLVVSGAIQPLLAESFALEDMAAAQAAFSRKDFVGKLVIQVAS